MMEDVIEERVWVQKPDTNVWNDGELKTIEHNLKELPPNKWKWSNKTPIAPFVFKRLACCGIVELSSIQDVVMKLSKETFEKWVEWEFRPRDSHSGHHPGILLASAATGQDAYKKWLKKVGFDPLQTFHNHNSGNKVSLFSYTISAKDMGERVDF